MLQNKVACIGSRVAPPRVLESMVELGRLLIENGYQVASGNAEGSDQAYAQGANQIDPTKLTLYLPWPKFNKDAVQEGNKVVLSHHPDWEGVATANHKAYSYLSYGTKKLLCRNVGIVENSLFVIAYLNPNKKGGGGTGHGVRIASHLSIPVFELRNDAASFEKIKNRIRGG